MPSGLFIADGISVEVLQSHVGQYFVKQTDEGGAGGSLRVEWACVQVKGLSA